MRLFVYGTLKKDHRAHDLLSNWSPIFLGQAVTKPQFQLYRSPGFPTLVFDESLKGGVHGELYEVSNECMEALDEYEAVEAGLFRRDTVELNDGSTAVAYFYCGSVASRFVRVENGVF